MLLFLSSLTALISAAAIPESVDVAIVGAGLAGLTAARDLLKAGKSVVVLEGRNRVGGKVYNYPLKNGGVTEVGAEFVGPTQDKVLQMISDLGLKTFDTYIDGQTVLYLNSTRSTYTPDPTLAGAPPLNQADLVQIASARAQLDGWAAELNTSAPWSHPKSSEWDSITFQQYMDQQQLLPDARLLLVTLTKSLLAANPDEISLLYLLAYIAAAGNETTVGTLERLLATQGGAQEKRVVGGTGLIPQRLAEKVGVQHIAFNAAVFSVTKTYSGYDIQSRAGKISAKSVVLAMAPPLLNQIKFNPELPSSRQRLNRKMKMAAIGKGIPIYKTPFWRKEGLSAQVISDSGPTRVTFDSTPEDAAFGAILGFILADEMRALDKLSPEECQKQLLDSYVKYFGAQAANITEFVLQRWDLEEFSRGGPVAIASPNILTRDGKALRQSVGGIHFAGTETSEFWTGYMDGAIRSGERVAKEILSA
ncbi:putative flavin-containing monoamine oxidase A [Curvularia clavata]|uniref:Amine oxidase n=1 Tax=Curvularia clavata TaxID=95742 RepID=A0A9Q9DPX9_CURCL|nr:putative flavin-containing monoamine oxidase A [Curvularia clavata]